MRTTQNIIFLFALLVLGSSLSVSCVSLKSHLKLTHRSSNVIPIDAFAFVSVEEYAKPSKCLPSPREEECNAIIDSLPPAARSGSGSGLLVWAKKKPVFLTAAHVCTSDLPDVYESQGIKFEIHKQQKISIRGQSGEFTPAEIIHIDQEKDLCALSVQKMDAAPVKISRREPQIGDDVYAISAPFGISAPTMNLIFAGKYAGKDGKWHFYTIPTRPGSSGSVVLDENFRAVGMLNAAFLDIEHVGLGAGHMDLVEFLSEIQD